MLMESRQNGKPGREVERRSRASVAAWTALASGQSVWSRS